MKVDTVIVGAGTAGLSALREVRRYTDDFVLVNDGRWGTTCATTGCMPSKALIEAANAYHRRHSFDAFGISGAEALRADIPAVLAHVRRLRDQFSEGPASVRDRLGDRAISGRARLAGPGRVDVAGRMVEARAVILAPGSQPVVPGPWQRFGERILTTDSLFEQDNLPGRIAVVGMGFIGVELAQGLARLGLDVAGFDAVETVAGIDDPEVLEALRPGLSAEFALYLGGAAELEEAGDAIRVSGAGGAFEADAIVAAMGRRPNVEGLGLDTLGVPLDDHGMPETDPETLRIGGLDVFLAGDANGYRPLLHEAADEGYIAGRMANPEVDCNGLCRRTPLSVTFCDPQVARVGPPLSELEGQDIVSATADFSGQGRARLSAASGGILRVQADRRTGRLLAAEMCTPAAEHLAHLLALAVEREITVAGMLAMPVYHPVLEEGLRSALRDLARQVPPSEGPDLSECPDIGHAALD